MTTPPSPTANYALALSEEEARRYRIMAQSAVSDEADDLAVAGVVPGARIADVGCGPGATLAALAGLVGPSGEVEGVDRDEEAVRRARREVEGLANVTVAVGNADDTRLEPGGFDVAMCRHVLAHNGGREQRIVDHLATLAKPGGSVYLVDVDMTAGRLSPSDPYLDIDEYYRAFHARRGNDLTIGLRLGTLLEDAGLEVERYRCASTVRRLPEGIRGPHWAAREAMLDDGVASPQDLARWDAAFRRMDAAPRRPWMFVPMLVAIGRKPASARARAGSSG